MKNRRFSYDWTLFSTSVIFFIFGKYISPYYEKMVVDAGMVDEAVPVSTYCYLASGILAVCFVLRQIFLLKGRSQ